MSGGHMLAADLDGGNSMIFAKDENVIKSRLAGTSILLSIYKKDQHYRCFFEEVNIYSVFLLL